MDGQMHGMTIERDKLQGINPLCKEDMVVLHNVLQYYETRMHEAFFPFLSCSWMILVMMLVFSGIHSGGASLIARTNITFVALIVGSIKSSIIVVSSTLDRNKIETFCHCSSCI